MCRNIKPLFNFEPPATKAEIHDASLQFVRKLSGFQLPSAVNEKAFNTAVKEIEPVVQKLINSMSTDAPAKNREIEHMKAHERAVRRFGS